MKSNFTSTEKSRVSVVLCSYNGEEFIKEQIDSILNQTYPIHELIIQDDNSKDKTIEIINKYISNPKVRIFYNKKTLGFNLNFLSSFQKVTGDFVASCDQDDIWKENKIEVLISKIDNNSLIFHNSIVFTSDKSTPSGFRNISTPIINETYLLLKPYIPGHQCFFSKEILPSIKEISLIEPNVSYDSILCLVSQVTGGVKYTNDALVYWRRHPNATSYVKSPKKLDGIKGVFFAVAALFNVRKREIVKRYFCLIENLPFKEDASKKIVMYMKTGSMIGIIRACFTCIKNQQLFSHNGRKDFTKVFLTPLYFIRDCSQFIIK
jgi:glycosyltransferase involved in cell wall biosynthesis